MNSDLAAIDRQSIKVFLRLSARHMLVCGRGGLHCSARGERVRDATVTYYSIMKKCLIPDASIAYDSLLPSRDRNKTEKDQLTSSRTPVTTFEVSYPATVYYTISIEYSFFFLQSPAIGNMYSVHFASLLSL